jgi:HEAT repeat protein
VQTFSSAERHLPKRRQTLFERHSRLISCDYILKRGRNNWSAGGFPLRARFGVSLCAAVAELRSFATPVSVNFCFLGRAILGPLFAEPKMNCRFGTGLVCWAVLLGTTFARAGESAPAARSAADLGKATASGTPEKRLEAIDALADLGPEAKTAVPQLIAALAADDPAVRWHAARALGAVGPGAADAAPKLAAALSDKDFHVRGQAAHALGQIGAASKKYVPELIARITDEHASVRKQVIQAVSAIDPQDEKAAKKIADALSAAEPQVAMAAVRSLAAYGEKALPTTIEVLKTAKPKSKARYWACVLAGQFGPAAKDAVEPLAAALKDEDPSIRMQAAMALGSIGPAAKSAVPALAGALTDKLEAVQYAAAYALGSIGAEQALPALKKAAGSKDTLVRLLTTWAIAKAKPDDKEAMSKAVDTLVSAMEDDRPEVRHAASRALWDLQPPPDKLGPALSQALNDDDPAVVQHVIESLASLGAKIAPRLSAALADEKKRPKALAIIQRMGPEAKACVPDLAKLLADPEEALQVDVLAALGAIGPGAVDALPQVSTVLDSESQPVVSAACIALGRMGNAAESAAPAITKQLKSKSDYTQIAAAWALVQIGKDRSQVAKVVLPVLVKSLDSPTELIRAEAAGTLGSLGPAAKPATADLQKAAADPDPAVSRAATAALEKIAAKKK